MNSKVKSELLVPVLRINVISNLGCRSLCMAFLPPFSGVFRLSLSGSWPGIPCRRSFDFQGSMKACRKHITMKQKFLGSIPSGFQCILGETQGKTGRNASASWKMFWIEHTIKSLDFLGLLVPLFTFKTGSNSSGLMQYWMNQR